MALKYYNRIWEVISNPGSSASITLSGTAKDASYLSVTSRFISGDSFYYLIKSSDGSQTVWEIGIGVYNGGTSFTRDIVLSNSSDNNTLISFPAGSYDLMNIVPSEYISISPTIGQTLGLINNTYFSY